MDKSVSLVSGIGDLKTTKKYYDDWSRKYDSTLNKILSLCKLVEV